MTRRDLLRLLLSAPIAATLDVEKLLWVPGQQVAVPALWVPGDGSLFNPRKPIAQQYRAGMLAAGDIITIDGWFKFDPLTGRRTKELQEFVVGAPVHSSNVVIQAR